MKEESQPMRIHLAPHVLVETVGDKVVLLDTSTTLVHTLPSTQVVSVDTETRVLTLHKDASHEQHALEPFTEKAENVSGITRRAAVGLGGVAVTSSLLTFSLPVAAAASSEGEQLPQIFGVWVVSGGSGNLNFDIDVDDARPFLVDGVRWTLKIEGRSETTDSDRVVDYDDDDEVVWQTAIPGSFANSGDILKGTITDGTTTIAVVFVEPEPYSSYYSSSGN
jgi:hypothetical protein